MHYRINYPQVINETIDGEAIIINLVTGSYYSLDKTGAEVWELVERLLPVPDIVAELERRYEPSGIVITTAIESLLEQLSREQLIVQQDGQGEAASREQSSANAATSSPMGRKPFTPPRLEKFTDMQDLILLDPVHEVDSRGWPHVKNGRTDG